MKRKKITKTLACTITVLMLSFALFSCGSSGDTGSIAERYDYDPDKVTPTDTSQIAVLKGSWYDMGYQLGEQFKDEVIASTVYLVSGQIDTWGSYEDAVEAFQPYLEEADEHFMHEKDGGLTDMIQGTADSTGMTFEDTMMLYIDAASEVPANTPSGTGEGEAKGEDEKDCSATMIWGNATATKEKGCIGAMKADIGYSDLNFMPTMIMYPDNGNAFISTHGVFGSTANEKGFMVQSPGGSVLNYDEVYRVGIYPAMYLAAYCDNTEEAIAVLGNPETTDREEWWPIGTDFNMVLGDAEGNACVFEIAGSERNIRYNGETKYVGKTDAGDAIIENETSDYLCAANFYMSDNMLFTSRVSPQAGLDEGWPDGIIRYWSLEKHIQEAVENGGADAESLRKAMSSYKYYIPEGWDYDAFPDYDYYGLLVPSDVYEGFEDGSVKRADYYGDIYDTEEWGTPMSLEDSRSTSEWSTGWHDNLNGDWTWNLDTGYWSPEPVVPDTKTGLINIFDSNTKTMYLQKGSTDRALSNIPNSTGTFATLQFADEKTAEIYGGDKAKAMVDSMYYELEEQLWFAARDLNERGIEPDTANGKILHGYLEDAREMLYKAQSYAGLANIAETESEKLSYYSKAMTEYVKGQCYAKMAQTDPATLEKDYGKYEPEIK